MSLKEKIEKIAFEHEVDLVGFAKVEKIKLAHPPRPASDLLPNAKTAIVFAGQVLKGNLACPRGTKGAIKDAQVAYDRIQEAAAAVGRFLERNGHVAYFPPASMPCDSYKRNGKEWFAGEWSHRQAAIAAGLGVKGWNNLLVTPEFGPRVRLGSMLTTAEIDFEPRIIEKSPCTECGKCIDICPVGALNPKGDSYLDQPKCRGNYARPYMDKSPLQVIKNAFTIEGFATYGMQALMEGYHFSCAECQRICPAGEY